MVNVFKKTKVKISPKFEKLYELKKKIEDSLLTPSSQADALKSLSESKEFNDILTENQYNKEVKRYHNMLYNNNLKNVYNLLKNNMRHVTEEYTLDRKNILENAKYVLDKILPKRKIKIDKKELKRLKEKIIENEKMEKKMCEEYQKKVEEVGNDEDLGEIFTDLLVLLQNSIKSQNLALASFEKDELSEFEVKEYKKIIEKFPSIIFGFEDADKKFNTKYNELSKFKIKSKLEKVLLKNIEEREKKVENLSENKVIDKEQKKRTLSVFKKLKKSLNKLRKSKSKKESEKLVEEIKKVQKNMKKDLNDELKTSEKNKDKKSVNDIKFIQNSADIDKLLN